ncbi:DNA repair protein XRCC4-like [Nelusetta ayraudi]|uniref:DNA repair protein XRCC4-like n=1 Tax=Nelusetta ayraudi TaxID=303726 RepID=UPI003F70ABC5
MSGNVQQITVTSYPQTPYFLRVDWAEDLGAGFTIALTDGSSAWIGEVSEDEVTEDANDVGLARGEHVKDLLGALTGGRRGRQRDEAAYSFSLAPDHGRLSYQKISNGVPVHLGCVELQPAPDPVELNREMIALALKCNVDLKLDNSQLLDGNRRLKQQNQVILQELEQQVQDKEELERKLYSRFVPVMNEKKAKIRSLQDELQHLQRTDDKQSDKEERQSDSKRRRGGGGDQKGKEESRQSFHPSQEPTILITGRDLECHGISVDRAFSDDEEEPPRRKQRPLHTQSPDPGDED